jgi:site-specific recombinase XerD
MKHKIKEHLNQKERELLLSIPNQRKLEGLRDFCILSLMLLCGLRRQEVCNLKRKDLKIEGKKFKLYVFGKGSRWRKIPIASPDLIFALERYFKKQGHIDQPEAPMFWQIRFKKASGPLPFTAEGVRWLVSRYVSKANFQKRITAHSLRHSCLTNALQRGVDLATVQALAGHSNISTTSRYLHTTEERLEMCAEKLALG